MRYLAVIKIAFRALRRNKLRTVLTMLGIIFGVGAVIAVVALGRGAKAAVQARIASLGQNLIQIYSGSINRSGVYTGFGGAGTLTVGDADAIRNEVPGVQAVSPEVRTSAQIQSGENNWSTQVMGEDVDYLIIRDWDMAEGNMFTDNDVRTTAKVCVLGKTTANQLFPDGGAVGQIIRIKNVPVKVLGVLWPKGSSAFGQDQDDTVIVPYTTDMKRFAGQTMLRSINVSAANASDMTDVQNAITDLLRQRHRIQAGHDDDFMLRSQQDLAETQTATADTMTGLLAVVAIISLIVGGIGIMNIMLVSVTERTREIGIRMAVGARGRDILLQFLVEAVTLSSIGGILGILLGISAHKLLVELSKFCEFLNIHSTVLTALATGPTLVSYDIILIAFITSAIVGVISGFYPAWKASQLDPIDALRYE